MADRTYSKISYLSIRQVSEGDYIENRERLAAVTFKPKYINLRYFVEVKGTAMNHDSMRLLRCHQQQQR
jgi:hypothetical protein